MNSVIVEKKHLNSMSDSTSMRLKFIELDQLVESFCLSAGCQKVRAFNSPELPYFSSLDKSKKMEVIKSLKVFVEVCEASLAANCSLQDSRSFVWYGLSRLGLTFESDLFDHISENDVVEIYDKNNIQIFSNFRFMEHVSYTIEDLYCRPWTELFHRPDPKNVIEVINYVGKFYTKETLKPKSFLYLGKHRVEEVSSMFKHKIDLLVKSIHPLFDGHNNPVGFISIEEGEMVSSAYGSKAEAQFNLKSMNCLE